MSYFSLFVFCCVNILSSVCQLCQCFIFIPSYTHSKLVLNLNEFLSSAEYKCYFEEGGKPNSFWSTVTSIIYIFSTIKVNVDLQLFSNS